MKLEAKYRLRAGVPEVMLTVVNELAERGLVFKIERKPVDSMWTFVGPADKKQTLKQILENFDFTTLAETRNVIMMQRRLAKQTINLDYYSHIGKLDLQVFL